jgi:hypothetical protein
VEALRDGARELRRPFTAYAVKFKVQATWPQGSPATALVVPYIDARLVSERLNLVLPHLWHDPEYVSGQDGTLVCRLTVDGTTRQDVGSGYKGKGLYSDAFKRAAVKFGVGVSLYAVPKIVLEKKNGGVKETAAGGKKTLKLTDQGDRECRELYQRWLDAHGAQAFGPPLDHGDVEGAAGDVEAEAEPVAQQRPAEPAPAALDDEEALRLVDEIRSKYDRLREADREVLPPAQFNSWMQQSQHSHQLLVRFSKHLDQLVEEASDGS